jgi:hypothetical protein
MEPEQAKKLLEKLVGREVVVFGKPSAGGGMGGFNAVGKLKKSEIEGLWEVSTIGLDPTRPPQVASPRPLCTHFSECLVGGVIEMGELSAVSPAAIARPGGGLFK